MTPEAKRKKNQKKKLRQKQKKAAEKQALNVHDQNDETSNSTDLGVENEVHFVIKEPINIELNQEDTVTHSGSSLSVEDVKENIIEESKDENNSVSGKGITHSDPLHNVIEMTHKQVVNKSSEDIQDTNINETEHDLISPIEDDLTPRVHYKIENGQNYKDESYKNLVVPSGAAIGSQESQIANTSAKVDSTEPRPITEEQSLPISNELPAEENDSQKKSIPNIIPSPEGLELEELELEELESEELEAAPTEYVDGLPHAIGESTKEKVSEYSPSESRISLVQAVDTHDFGVGRSSTDGRKPQKDSTLINEIDITPGSNVEISDTTNEQHSDTKENNETGNFEPRTGNVTQKVDQCDANDVESYLTSANTNLANEQSVRKVAEETILPDDLRNDRITTSKPHSTDSMNIENSMLRGPEHHHDIISDAANIQPKQSADMKQAVQKPSDHYEGSKTHMVISPSKIPCDIDTISTETQKNYWTPENVQSMGNNENNQRIQQETNDKAATAESYASCDNLFANESLKTNEKMPWETDEKQAEINISRSVEDLFSNDSAEPHEQLPWETKELTASIYSHETTEKLFKNESSTLDEKMPWEGEYDSADVDQLESTNDLLDKETADSHQDAPLEMSPSKRQARNVELNNEDISNPNLNETHTTVSGTEHISMVATHQEKVERDVPIDVSQDTQVDTITKPFKENVVPSQENIQHSNHNKETNAHMFNDETSTATQNHNHQITKNSDTIDDLFTRIPEDDHVKMPWESINTNDNEENSEDQQWSGMNSKTTEIKKFSFLEEDDDMLEDDSSQADSFLESDEDEILVKPESNKGKDQDALAVQDFVTSDPVKIPPGDMTYNNGPGSPSVSSSGRTSRYEPQSVVPSTIYSPRFPLGTSGDNKPLPNTMQSLNVGIVPPQPIQPVIKSQNVEAAVKNEIYQKLNDAKKKSDAYDFPMDLVPNKMKPVHAKPVGVPSQFNPKSNIAFEPGNKTKSSTPTIERKCSSGWVAQPPVPINPYEKASMNRETSQNVALPPQAMGMPQAGITNPSIVGMAPNHTRQPAVNQYQPMLRSRGVSNVSNISGSSFGTTTPDPSIPFPQQVNNATFQGPPGIKKRSANRYAPVSSGNINMPHPPINAYSGPAPPMVMAPMSTQSSSSHQATIGTAINNQVKGTQKEPLPSLNLHVPTTGSLANVVSPTSASSTRRYHARSNSSVYAPNQNEHTSKYAPTVHPQYQNAPLQPNYPLQQKESMIIHPATSILSSNMIPHHQVKQINPVATPPVDNQALLHRQFPIFSWSGSDNFVYGLPSEGTDTSYMMGPGSNLQEIKIVKSEAVLKPNSLLRTFPGPLMKNKTKRKDVEKWLEGVLDDSLFDDSSLLKTIVQIFKIKSTEKGTWREISSVLYNSDELFVYLSQPFVESQQQPVSHKLDGNNQMKVLAHLQTGGHEEALELALGHQDYAIALLIGSLMGKEKWSEVVQEYLNHEFQVVSDVSNFSTNLLSLIFQVFVGNSKKAIREFSSIPMKHQWALENWKLIVSAILNNINLSSGISSSSIDQVPPVILEFLVEFGLFLATSGYVTQACVLFVIANLPLSPLTLADSTIKFESIGESNSMEGRLLTEVYEFLCPADAKGLSNMISQKLQQAFCFQELGMTTNATRYIEYVGAALKSLPKKDQDCIKLLHSLNELSSRITGTSSGWLGKPKLSSVWGQLDKSFNKYIGGDDDMITKKAVEKKVFDRFTPVPSRNSSMVDVSQYQFTPYQSSNQQQPHLNKGVIPSFETLGRSPPNNAIVPISNISATIPIRGVSNEVTSQYISSKVSQSLQGSPQKSPYIPSQPATSGNYTSQLRRVQTEQMSEKSQNSVYADAASVEIPQFPVHSTNIAESTYLPRKSLHYNSTPNLLRRESSNSVEVAPPPKIKTLSKQNSPVMQRVTPIPSNNVPSPLIQPKLQTAIKISKDVKEDSSTAPMYENTPVNIKTNHPTNLAHENLDVKETIATSFCGEVRAPEVVKEVSDEESDISYDLGNTTVLHTDLAKPLSPLSVEDKQNHPTELPAVYEPIEIGSEISKDIQKPSYQSQILNENSLPSNEDNHQGAIPIQNRQIPPEDNHDVAFSLNNQRKNPYAPKLTATSASLNSYAPKSTTGGIYSNKLSVPQQEEPNVSDELIPSDSNGVPDHKPIISDSNSNRFDPIKPPEAMSPESFVPVIKTPAERLFTPRIQSPEIQYDDVVEDESDESDDEVEQKKRKEEEERRKLEREREEKRKEEEREKLQRQRAKEKTGDEGQNSGWFGWLKKETNEKKPIKAKLGHKKSTFYYDEKLKRWVNKNSTEEEKEKVSSPPPPPPVVKRMDNGPKTKPQSLRDVPRKEGLGPILPQNPLTGEAMTHPTTSSSPDPTPIAKLPEPAAALPANVNLSGKKANGLDDLLTLSGTTTAGKRKKRAARGYVNVMENK